MPLLVNSAVSVFIRVMDRRGMVGSMLSPSGGHKLTFFRLDVPSSSCRALLGNSIDRRRSGNSGLMCPWPQDASTSYKFNVVLSLFRDEKLPIV